MRRALANRRGQAGLSQQDVARAVGISRSFYTLIERGARNPSLVVALRLAALLGAAPEELFAPPQFRAARPGRARAASKTRTGGDGEGL